MIGCKKHINGCIACEYCHTKGHGTCVQEDDMQEVYTFLKEADMYDGAMFSFNGDFLDYLGLENMGVFYYQSPALEFLRGGILFIHFVSLNTNFSNPVLNTFF